MAARPSRSVAFAVTLVAALCPLFGAEVQFVDASARSGLDFRLVSGSPEKPYILESMTGGVGFIDYDNDGWIDIYLVNGGTLDSLQGTAAKASNRLFRNQGDGTFIDVTESAAVGDRGWGMGVAVADVDNNGFDDLYVTNYGPNRLYLNLGNGTFRESAEVSGVAGDAWSSSAGFGDYDNDGDVDLYVTNYLEFDPAALPDDSQLCRYRGIRVQCGPRGMAATGDRFFENRGDGRFADASAASGIGAVSNAYGLGVVWADYDNDGDQDIYVANDSTANYLFQNNGDKTFSEVALLVGVALSANGSEQAGMGVDFGDYDNDGLMDLAVTNFSDDYNALYRNEGDGLFLDVSYKAGLAEPTWAKLSWGIQFADLDLDGDLDIVIADGHVYPEVDRHDFGLRYRQPNSVFLNNGDGSLRPVGLLPGDSRAESSRGLAIGDINNDGALDILIANLDAAPTLLEGSSSGKHWLMVELVGTTSNRSAIGARVTVETSAGSQIREVRSGGSYQSQRDLRVHFGLGDIEEVDLLRIRWPNGTEQRMEGVESDRIVRVKEPTN